MCVLLQHLRIACSAKNDKHLTELRVSTMLIRQILDRGEHFYDGVACEGEIGWVWLHHFGYRAYKNITFANAKLEWSFYDGRPNPLFGDVTWAYISPKHVARVMSDVVYEDCSKTRHSNVLATEGKCRLLRRAAAIQ